MTEDYRPICYFCGKTMNKKDRINAQQKRNPNTCITCEKFLIKKIKEDYK